MTRVGPRNRVLDGSPNSPQEGALLRGGHAPEHCNVHMHGECACQAPACPEHVADQCICRGGG